MTKFFENSKLFFMKHNAALKIAGTICGVGVVVGTPYINFGNSAQESSIVKFEDFEVNSIANSASKPLLQEVDYYMNVASDNEFGEETVNIKDLAYTLETKSGETILVASRYLDKNGNADLKQKQALLYTKKTFVGTDADGSNKYEESKAYATAYLVYNEDGTSEYRLVTDLKHYAEEKMIELDETKKLVK